MAPKRKYIGRLSLRSSLVGLQAFRPPAKKEKDAALRQTNLKWVHT